MAARSGPKAAASTDPFLTEGTRLDRSGRAPAMPAGDGAAAVPPPRPEHSPWATAPVEGTPAEGRGRRRSMLGRLLRRAAPPEAADRRACAAVIDALPEMAVILHDDGTMRYASPATTRLLGRPGEWLRGHPLAALVHTDDREGLAELLEPFLSGVGGSPRMTAELRLSHLNGHWIDVVTTAIDLREVPGVEGIVVTMRSVAEHKAVDRERRRLALHDPLTNLANRALFRDHVERALDRGRRADVSLAVLFVDLDGFKNINDSLGHAAGDQVLRTVAARLAAGVRPGDTAARLGGDEFAVLMENSTEQDADRLAHRLLEAVRRPISLHGREVVVTGSVGIAMNSSGQDAEELLRNADVAMYRAKDMGRGRSQVFEPEMQLAALKRLLLEADLRQAVEREELTLQYQPIVALGSGEVTGMEALARWRHPERGMVPPADFIAVAEDSGLIGPLGRWVLREACLQGRRLSELHAPSRPLRIFVNASVRQIEGERFREEVADALAYSGLDPSSLTLEITESLFMNDLEGTVAKLCDLKLLGIKIAIDDFGTGYSSLSYLRYLPIDILKIDKSFVGGITRGAEESAVARAVVKLARTFGLQTVAEGIENAGQMSALAGIGADMGQGYHLARPLDPEAMEAFLASRNPRPADAVAQRSRPARRLSV